MSTVTPHDAARALCEKIDSHFMRHGITTSLHRELILTTVPRLVEGAAAAERVRCALLADQLGAVVLAKMLREGW